MNYPVWELELGGGLLIAIVAIIHVYISHFAIGGGLFLVVTEHYAYLKDDKDIIQYLKSHSKFFALVTLVAGALTGVGIWFTIGLINPAAVSALIRIFLWAWAIEWVFFFVEIAAAIIYYISWDKVSRKTHLIFGWIYFIAAFLSLVAINGIITFMLTPGNWLETHNIWDGIFNPTYFPSLVSRTAICAALAGSYTFLTGHFIKKKSVRSRIIRYAGIWGLAGAVLAIPGMWWYHSLLPEGSGELFAGGLPAAATASIFLLGGGITVIVLMLIPVILPRKFGFGWALFISSALLITFGASEWVREAIRKPFVIYGYMYGNSMTQDDYKYLEDQGGILTGARWVKNREQRPDAVAGKEAFRNACRICHTISGYNGLAGPLSGLDEDFIFELVKRTEHIRGKMPPFPGSEIEARGIAVYLHNNLLSEILTSGEQIFEKRCGFCHTVNNEFRPLYDSMEGMELEEIQDLLTMLEDMADEMPQWTGTDEEAIELSEYIVSWYKVEQNDDEGGK